MHEFLLVGQPSYLIREVLVTSITGGTICGLPILYGRLVLWLTGSRLWEAIEDISPPAAHRTPSSTACSQPMQLDWLPVSPRDLPLYLHSARVPATLLHTAFYVGSRGLASVSHACVASTLPTEQSP